MKTSASENSPNSATSAASSAESAELNSQFTSTTFASFSLPVNSATINNQDTLVDRRSPLPLDNAYVQQTKDQIRVIVQSIASLANSIVEPRVFAESALGKVKQAMGAIGAALWQQMPDSSWRLLSSVNLPEGLTTGFPTSATAGSSVSTRLELTLEQLEKLESELRTETDDDSPKEVADRKIDAPSPSHKLILDAVAKEKQPILIPPAEVSLSSQRPKNPTSELLMYAPLTISEKQSDYWLQVVQSPSGGPSSQRGYLRFVAQMADLFSEYFRTYRLRIFERDREYLTLAERTMNELSLNVDSKRGLSKLMGTIREHAQADHAFLLYRGRRFGRWQVVAAAGLVDIDRRAIGIEQIERAAPFFQSQYASDGLLQNDNATVAAEERDPDLSQFLKTFAVRYAGWSKPLQTKKQTSESVAIDGHARRDVAILTTWSTDGMPPEQFSEQCSLVARLGLSALQIPWWKAALLDSNNARPRALSFASPATWPRIAYWAVGFILFALILSIPVPIRLNATAVLVPTEQQHIYAPWDAIVEKVFVEHGAPVKAGEPILQLTSQAIQSEYENVVTQQLRNTQRLSDIEGRLLRETSLTSTQRDELEGERIALQSIQVNEQRLIGRLKHQLESMLIVAQFDGIVATWNVKSNLRDRPVRTGQWLMSIHQANSQWMLEAVLPEQHAQELRVALLEKALTPVATMTGAPEQTVTIRYNQETTPRIEARSANASPEFDSNANAILRLRFDVDGSTLPENTATAGATARISIPAGTGPLGWAIGKDFVRRAISQIRLWI